MTLRNLALGLVLVAVAPACGHFPADRPAEVNLGPPAAVPSHSARGLSRARPSLVRLAEPAGTTCPEGEGPASVPLPEPLTFGDFWAALATQVDGLDTAALGPRFQAFAARHGADASSPQLRQDFVRLWVLFEATRDGGWWRLRWQVTDQQPTSQQIWKAWQRSRPTHSFATATAVAECDEISALFAVAARRLGVRNVGLFYPTWNHVIAGWAPQGVDQRERGGVVLIPTTQIFQGCPATFDQTSFKPPKHVYEFPKVDVNDSAEMPPSLAAFLLEQVRAYGEASPTLLALIRAKRAELFQSSLGDCADYRRQLQHDLAQALTCADRRALRHLARVELKRPDLTDENALSFLAEP
jgi:hypothetical protein